MNNLFCAARIAQKHFGGKKLVLFLDTNFSYFSNYIWVRISPKEAQKEIRQLEIEGRIFAVDFGKRTIEFSLESDADLEF